MFYKGLGLFKLKGIPPAPRGVPKISVTFQLDVNGLLSVSAREEKSGQEQSIKIEGASVLAREDVSKMIKEAEENANIDRSKKSIVNITYELDNLLSKAEKFLDTVLSLETEELYLLEVLKEVKSLYKSKQLSKCYAESLSDLKTAYNFLRAKSIKTELAKSGNSSGSNGGSGQKRVIDTDFES